jgi:hypothetical protein
VKFALLWARRVRAIAAAALLAAALLFPAAGQDAAAARHRSGHQR